MKKYVLKTLSLIFALNIILISNIFGATNFTVSSPNGNIGKEVSVDVSINDNTGFVGYQMLLNYDTSKLEYISSSNGDLVSSKLAVISDDKQKGTIKQACVSSNTINENGKLLTLTFKIKDSITSDNIPVNLSIQKLINDTGDGDIKNVEYTISNGNIILGNNKKDITSTTTKDLISIIKNADGKISLNLKAGTTDRKILYRSTDETKATVDAEGNVTTFAPGDVEIEALVGSEVVDTITLNIPSEEKSEVENINDQNNQEKIIEKEKFLNKKNIIIFIIIIIIFIFIAYCIKYVRNKKGRNKNEE